MHSNAEASGNGTCSSSLGLSRKYNVCGRWRSNNPLSFTAWSDFSPGWHETTKVPNGLVVSTLGRYGERVSKGEKNFALGVALDSEKGALSLKIHCPGTWCWRYSKNPKLSSGI